LPGAFRVGVPDHIAPPRRRHCGECYRRPPALRALDAEKKRLLPCAPLCGRWFLGEGAYLTRPVPIPTFWGAGRRLLSLGGMLPGDFFILEKFPRL